MRLVVPLLLGLLLAAPALAALPEEPAPGERRWLVGDWHVHTSHSHDACGADELPNYLDKPAYDACGDGLHTLSPDPATRMREAEARGLDYVRITDHNTVAGLAEAAAYGGPVLLIPGYEHSLPNGHAGVTTLDLAERGVLPATSAESLADAVRAAPGGLFVVNHPRYGDDDWSAFDWSRADAFELWNNHWLYRDEVFQGLVTTSDNDEALALWTSLLHAGHRLPIVGGSDSHWLLTSGAQGIGQPATWVRATDRTPEAILDAVREGRTIVTSDFATLPPLFYGDLQGDGVPDGIEVGDSVPVGGFVWLSGIHAPLQRLTLRTCDGGFSSVVFGGAGGIATSLDTPGCWAYGIVEVAEPAPAPRHFVVRAVTSPIWAR